MRRYNIYILLKHPVILSEELQQNVERGQREGEDKSRATVRKTKEQDGEGEKALWGPSFSSTSGPDISELISHAGVVCG